MKHGSVRGVDGPCIAWSTTALAQSPVAPGEWNRCTTLNAFVGASGDTTRVGTALGAAIGWEITPALGIEGAGAWTEFGQETTAFSGTLKLRARVGGTRTVDPFFLAGIGIYPPAFGEKHGDPRFLPPPHRAVSARSPGPSPIHRSSPAAASACFCRGMWRFAPISRPPSCSRTAAATSSPPPPCTSSITSRTTRSRRPAGADPGLQPGRCAPARAS